MKVEPKTLCHGDRTEKDHQNDGQIVGKNWQRSVRNERN